MCLPTNTTWTLTSVARSITHVRALLLNSHRITDLILQQFQEPVHIYLSTDRVVTDNPEEAAANQMEFLNAQTPSGLLKH